MPEEAEPSESDEEPQQTLRRIELSHGMPAQWKELESEDSEVGGTHDKSYHLRLVEICKELGPLAALIYSRIF